MRNALPHLPFAEEYKRKERERERQRRISHPVVNALSPHVSRPKILGSFGSVTKRKRAYCPNQSFKEIHVGSSHRSSRSPRSLGPINSLTEHLQSVECPIALQLPGPSNSLHCYLGRVTWIRERKRHGQIDCFSVRVRQLTRVPEYSSRLDSATLLGQDWCAST